MNTMNQSSSLNSGEDVDTDTYRIKKYVKDKLKSRVFLGRYVERRLADKEIGYRDVVVISPAEVELKADLLDVQYKLCAIAPNVRWIGITDAGILGYDSSGVCLWTEIDNQPFGPFWFQIKTINFRIDEIIVVVKCLRHISDAFLEVEPILIGAVKKCKDTSDNKLESSVASLNENYDNIVTTLKSFVSITNVKDFVTFLFAVVIAIFTGSTAFVNFIGNFILGLLREISIFISCSTPMFLGMLDFFSKIVGGFYILLAMLFRQTVPLQVDKHSLASYDRTHRNRRSNESMYDDRQFD